LEVCVLRPSGNVRLIALGNGGDHSLGRGVEGFEHSMPWGELARLWSFVDDVITQRFEQHLGGDLGSGRWDDKFGHLRSEPTFVGSLKIIIGQA
jgi:hypothetical protein